MRSFLLVIWLMLPALVGAYPYGPGQNRMMLDKAAEKAAGASEYWVGALAAYDAALACIDAQENHN